MVRSSGRVGRNLASAGFSVVEIVVVIGAIGVLAAIAIPSMINVLGSTKVAAAEANLEILNQAVLKYNHAVAELTNATASDSSDELAVITLLKTRDVNSPGSPYLEPTDNTVGTSDEASYRAVWNGRMFELREPGTNATGLNLMEMNDR